MWKFEILVFFTLNLVDRCGTSFLVSSRILLNRKFENLIFCEKLVVLGWKVILRHKRAKFFSDSFGQTLGQIFYSTWLPLAQLIMITGYRKI